MTKDLVGEYDFQTMKEEYLDVGGVVPAKWVNEICLKLIEQLVQEENLLVLRSPIVVCGDVHGQYEDVIELFKTAKISTDTKKSFREKSFLFMGDYVDRGYYSLNTFLLLAGLKLEYPDKYFLLRGNHESRQVTVQYGFYTEMQSNYGSSVLYNLVMDVFDLLPYSAIIDNEIFATHGGISPHLPLAGLLLNEERRIEIPNAGVLADLTWSDPDDAVTQWRLNTRGAGYLFGSTQVEAFCYNNGLKMITRSHQLAQPGYKWYFCDKKNKPDEEKECDKPLGSLLLVWSAPNYAYRSKNKASILEIGISGKKRYSLEIFDQSDDRIKLGDRNVTIPFFC